MRFSSVIDDGSLSQAKLSPELCQDLFGNWIVKRTWGSAVKRDFGRETYTVCPDYQTGLRWYEQQQSRRQKRGYSPLNLKLTD
jgi:hypothetical protein